MTNQGKHHPRTAKQITQAKAYSDAQGSFAAPDPPTRSWWLGFDTREEFDAAVERERIRMNAPKQGTYTPTTRSSLG